MANVITQNDPVIDPADSAMVERRSFSIPAAAVAANGNSDVFYVEDKGVLRLTQTTTAVSGTSPTLDVIVQTCQTSDGTFISAGTLAQITAASSQFKTFSVGRWVRLNYTVGGSSTPTVTVGFEAEAV